MAALIRRTFCSAPPNLPFGATHNDEFKVTTTWDASARVRAGWLANPSLMLYVTAGLAWAHLQVSSACSTVPTANVSNCAPGNYAGGTLGPDVITHSGTKLGWTAGAGAEMLLVVKLGGARAVSLRRFRLSVVRSLHALQLFGHPDLYRLCCREQPAVRLV